MYRFCCILFIAALFSGCGLPLKVSLPNSREPTVQKKTGKPGNALPVAKLLYDQHREWQGVPYKYNGLSKKGIDCSGFVYRTFKDKFARTIPRTTARLIKSGRPIDKKNLQPGDLVFFKTGLKKRHVGIYVEKKKFLHASTSKGVILSSLDNVYWKKHYWQARRI